MVHWLFFYDLSLNLKQKESALIYKTALIHEIIDSKNLQSLLIVGALSFLQSVFQDYSTIRKVSEIYHVNYQWLLAYCLNTAPSSKFKTSQCVE